MAFKDEMVEVIFSFFGTRPKAAVDEKNTKFSSQNLTRIGSYKIII